MHIDTLLMHITMNINIQEPDMAKDIYTEKKNAIDLDQYPKLTKYFDMFSLTFKFLQCSVQ